MAVIFFIYVLGGEKFREVLFDKIKCFGVICKCTQKVDLEGTGYHPHYICKCSLNKDLCRISIKSHKHRSNRSSFSLIK